MAFNLRVNGVAIKCPSSFSFGLQDISSPDAGRTQDTLMHKERVGQKVKLELSWNGLTWEENNQLLLDAENGWGYSCLTMIDRETVGIFYESSVAHMTFQAIKLKDIIKTK